MLSHSCIRYLLAIYQLSDGGAAVRSVDIARFLGVSRASVVKCLKKLSGEGLIQQEYYGSVQLTPLGIRQANRAYTEYTLLHSFLRNHLGLPPQSAHSDAICVLCCFSPEGRECLLQKALADPGQAERRPKPSV